MGRVYASHIYDNTTGCEIAFHNVSTGDCLVTEGDTVCISALAENGDLPGVTLHFWHYAAGYSDYLGSCVTDSWGICDPFCYILTPELRHGAARGEVRVSAGGLTATPKFLFRMRETLCETTCETACQDVCETLCQVGCEVGCEAACEVSCKTTCELYCQTGCEVSCETGCEGTCETGCEVSCETGCEVSEEVPIACNSPTPNFDSGCALLLYFDTGNDGIISATERDAAWEAEFLGLITHSEAQFVEDAYNAGSINALCPGCFVVPSLVISPTTHSSPSGGDAFTITVTSNIAWTVSDDMPWIHYTPPSGSGNGAITVTVDENTGTGARTGNVFVTGEGITCTCVVTQAGAAATCSQQFALQDKDTYLHITGASVKVGGVECTEYPSIERYQIDNLTIGSSYNAIASKAGYECPDTLCETTFTADPTNPAYNLYLKEIPIVDNYDIVFCVGRSIWGFDWIANNFVSKVLPKITSALNATGISGLVVHGEASYYDAEKKQIVVNADIPSHSPIAPLVLWLILTLVLPALIMLGVFIKETFFDKKGVEPAVVTLRTIDTDSNVITEPISLTVNGVTKTTSEGVVSFAVNENFQVLCVSDTWDIFDSTKWYEPTTAMQDVVLSSTATRSVKILVTDEAGNPLPNTEVHILDASGKYVRTATTDENGYVTLNMGAGEYTAIVINEQDIPTGTKKIGSGTEDLEEVIIVPEGYAIRVYARETGTSNYIDGANITVDGKTGRTDGKNGVLIADLEDKDYTITAQHPSYNNGDIVTYPEVVNPTTVLEDVIIDMDHTGEDVLVRIYPRYETTNLVGAKVQLEGFVEKTTTQLGFVEYSNVPYGEYTVTATKEDFTQKEPDKKYPVDESHTIEGVVTIVVVMESELIPPPPPPKLSMMLIYGVATVGLYVAGIFVPKVGKVVQVSAVIPGCLLIYEGYKYAKEKIPLLGTELEQLALPPKLTEPLRKKKVVIS